MDLFVNHLQQGNQRIQSNDASNNNIFYILAMKLFSRIIVYKLCKSEAARVITKDQNL